MKKRKYRSIGTRSFISIIIVGILISFGALMISYKMYSNTIKDHYNKLAVEIANTAAVALDKEIIKQYSDEVYDIYKKNPRQSFDNLDEYLKDYESVMDEGYLRLQKELADIKVASDVDSLYIIRLDKESSSGVYVADSAQIAPGVWDPIYEENSDIFEHPEEGFPPYVTNTKEYGWLVSTGVPIEFDGEIVGYSFVDISMNDVMGDINGFLMRSLVVLFIVTIILSAILAFSMNSLLIEPLKKLANAAENFVENRDEDNIDTESEIQKVHIKTNDEVKMLSDALKQMELDINSYITNITAITAEKERIGAELNVATEIQANMLPSIFPPYPNRPEFDLYATMTPAKEVGGDFYDFFMIDDDHLGLVMADVSGKGVPAALFMVIAKTLLKNRALIGGSPAEIIAFVNNQLCENNKSEMFVTCWLGILEISTGTVVAANAGHEFPCIKRKDSGYELFKDKHGFVLAGMEGMKYKDYEFTLNKGDSLFVYTDGVPEATDGDNQLFGTDRMLEALNNSENTDCEITLKNVQKSIDEFVNEAPQFDDITMLCLDFK